MYTARIISDSFFNLRRGAPCEWNRRGSRPLRWRKADSHRRPLVVDQRRMAAWGAIADQEPGSG
jgi:hypothetical protein